VHGAVKDVALVLLVQGALSACTLLFQINLRGAYGPLLSSLLMGMVLLAVVRLRLGNVNPFVWLALKPSKPMKEVLVGVCAVVVLYAFATLALAPLYLFSSKAALGSSVKEKEDALQLLRNVPLAPALALAAFAGFYEEVVFRGFLLVRLRDVFETTAGVTARRFVPMVLALTVSAALFAVGHLYQGTVGLIQTFAAGIALGALRIYRGNLIAPIAAHICIDSLGFILLRFF
jgi:membrane protease YdiL (CAAX protease family)